MKPNESFSVSLFSSSLVAQQQCRLPNGSDFSSTAACPWNMTLPIRPVVVPFPLFPPWHLATQWFQPHQPVTPQQPLHHSGYYYFPSPAAAAAPCHQHQSAFSEVCRSRRRQSVCTMSASGDVLAVRQEDVVFLEDDDNKTQRRDSGLGDSLLTATFASPSRSTGSSPAIFLQSPHENAPLPPTINDLSPSMAMAAQQYAPYQHISTWPLLSSSRTWGISVVTSPEPKEEQCGWKSPFEAGEATAVPPPPPASTKKVRHRFVPFILNFWRGITWLGHNELWRNPWQLLDHDEGYPSKCLCVDFRVWLINHHYGL